MNEIVNKFLLAGDRFMAEMHLRQPDLRIVLVDQLQKIKNELKRFKEAGDSRYIYQNELDKACFQHDMAYGDFKDLNGRTFVDKVFNIAKEPKYDGYQCKLASMVYKFVDKKTSGSGVKNENISNKELAEELHKPITRTFNKRKVHSSFKDNIQGTELADMQLISKFNKGFRFLLCY